MEVRINVAFGIVLHPRISASRLLRNADLFQDRRCQETRFQTLSQETRS